MQWYQLIEKSGPGSRNYDLIDKGRWSCVAVLEGPKWCGARSAVCGISLEDDGSFPVCFRSIALVSISQEWFSCFPVNLYRPSLSYPIIGSLASLP